MTERKYGYVASLNDQNDLIMTPQWSAFKPLPKEVDLTLNMPPVWDQLSIGSCSAVSGLATWYFVKKKQIDEKRDDDTNLFRPSFRFQYYNTRRLEGTIESDAGGTIPGAYKAMRKFGVAPETDCPYVIEKFREKPSDEAYNHALDSQMLKYFRVPKWLTAIQGCLADGFPITFGFAVYESFEDKAGVAKTGVLVKPARGEQLLGGHAVVLVGYSMDREAFLVRNSWGSGWGADGHFWFDFDLLMLYGSDFYTARVVE